MEIKDIKLNNTEINNKNDTKKTICIVKKDNKKITTYEIGRFTITYISPDISEDESEEK